MLKYQIILKKNTNLIIYPLTIEANGYDGLVFEITYITANSRRENFVSRWASFQGFKRPYERHGEQSMLLNTARYLGPVKQLLSFN